jgi:hypothetical protein
MFTFVWQRVCNNGKSSTALARRRRNHVRLHIEWLEDRVTPAAVDLTAVQSAAGVLTLSEPSATGLQITVAEVTPIAPATFGELIVTVPNGNTITGGGNTFTTQKPVTALTINLGSSPDLLTIGDSTFATRLKLPGALIINGTGGAKMINIDNVDLLNAAPLTVSLSGGNSQNFSDSAIAFTNVNVGGAAMIAHPGLGVDNVTITNNQAAGPNAVFKWGSLSITNSANNGTSNNTTINDTNFAGNVTISNGAASGANGNTGSTTIIQAANDQALATILGNLSVTSTAGPAHTELNDYNVGGNVTFSAAGSAQGAVNGNFFGLEDNPKDPIVPAIGGNVKITDGSTGSPPVTIDVGQDETDPTKGHALVIHGGLAVNGSGTAVYTVNLTDLKMATGAASITLSKQSSSNTINIGAVGGAVSDFGALNVTYPSPPPLNTFDTLNLQTASGEVDVAGSVNLQVDGNFDPTPANALPAPFPTGNGPLAIGSSGGKVNIGGDLTIAGTDDKQILVTNTRVNGKLNYNLTGVDYMDAEFTDSSVAGAATIMDSTFLESIVRIASTGGAPRKWGSLSLSTSYDSTVTINDTDFAGNVSVNAAGNTNGGVLNPITANTITLAANNDASLATIGGNLTISSGKNVAMNTSVNDYNVLGNVSISQSALSSGTSTAANGKLTVGLEDAPTLAGGAFIGGNVAITATSGSDAQAGSAAINLGTGAPLFIGGSLTVTGTGPNLAVDLNDLSVPNKATSVTLSGTSLGGDSLHVQGTSSVPSVFDSVTVNSTAGGANTFSIQDAPGTTDFGGTVSIAVGANATVNVGADSGNDTGVASAVVELFGKTTVTGGTGSTFFGAPNQVLNPNLLFFTQPSATKFAFS